MYLSAALFLFCFNNFVITGSTLAAAMASNSESDLKIINNAGYNINHRHRYIIRRLLSK